MELGQDGVAPGNEGNGGNGGGDSSETGSPSLQVRDHFEDWGIWGEAALLANEAEDPVAILQLENQQLRAHVRIQEQKIGELEDLIAKLSLHLPEP